MPALTRYMLYSEDTAARPLRPPASASKPGTSGGRRPAVPTLQPRLTPPVLHSECMLELYRTVEQVARHDVNVLVTGETGTGKELVAQTLHQQSPRAAWPLVAINCATLHPNLMCATLFGHERGAFTGADQKRAGVFEAADGGTVFLDEVGELDAGAQAALLRVLESGSFTPVGATREVRVHVRVVAATHRDLSERVRDGRFRGDLYYRLNTLGLEVPPLRARIDEIAPLAEHFLTQLSRRHDLRQRALSAEVLEILQRHRWPGNVRELRNVLERAAILARGQAIEASDLPERLLAQTAPGTTHAAHGTCNCHAEIGTLSGPSGAPGSYREAVQAYERQLIERALTATGGNRARAAERLGMPRRTLLHKLRALGLSADRTRSSKE